MSNEWHRPDDVIVIGIRLPAKNDAETVRRILLKFIRIILRGEMIWCYPLARLQSFKTIIEVPLQIDSCDQLTLYIDYLFADSYLDTRLQRCYTAEGIITQLAKNGQIGQTCIHRILFTLDHSHGTKCGKRSTPFLLQILATQSRKSKLLIFSPLVSHYSQQHTRLCFKSIVTVFAISLVLVVDRELSLKISNPCGSPYWKVSLLDYFFHFFDLAKSRQAKMTAFWRLWPGLSSEKPKPSRQATAFHCAYA